MAKDYLAKNIAQLNIAQFEDWSDSERNILRAIWEELKKTGSKKVELKLDELKDTCIVGQEHDTWDSVLETFPKKAIRLRYYGKSLIVSNFASIDIDPEHNKMTIETFDTSVLGFPVSERTFALDFLDKVMSEL
jgi:hypothetical protein